MEQPAHTHANTLCPITGTDGRENTCANGRCVLEGWCTGERPRRGRLWNTNNCSEIKRHTETVLKMRDLVKERNKKWRRADSVRCPLVLQWLSGSFWSGNSSPPFTFWAFYLFLFIHLLHLPSSAVFSLSTSMLPPCPSFLYSVVSISSSILSHIHYEPIRGFAELLCLMRTQSICFHFFSSFLPDIHIRCVFLLLCLHTYIYIMCVMYCEVPKRQSWLVEPSNSM